MQKERKKWKRIIVILIIFFGPGSIIFFISRTFDNKFIRLPYLGYEYTYNADSTQVVDSVAYQVPYFSLKTFDGAPITRDSIKGKFIVLTTIQNTCPNLDSCGLNIYHFNEIFYRKLLKNEDNYSNVRVISILTDFDGNPIAQPSERLLEEMAIYDTKMWWLTTGEVLPFYNFNYYGDKFINHPAVNEEGEIGNKAFINSLVLIDDKGHIRGLTGARKDSDIRNYFDLVKVLKKEEFDRKRGKG